MSARLLDLIAATEDALDHRQPYRLSGDPFEITARPALNQLAGQRDPGARADLALEVHRRVVAHAGDRAADVLIHVAAGYRHLSTLSLPRPERKELATR